MTIAVITGTALAMLAGGGRERKQMLAYMEEKYDEEFVYIEDYAGQPGKNYKMIRVRSKQRPEREALVRSIYSEEKTIFQDNYPAWLFKEEIEDRLRRIARPVLGECSVWYKIPFLVFPENFSADMEVDAFLRHPHSMIRVYFYPEADPWKDQGQGEALCKKLEEKGYQLAGTISWLGAENRLAVTFQTGQAW